MSFADKLVASRNELIWWVTGTDAGKPCWYYLQVEKSKQELFKARPKKGKINLTNYGTILYSGWGTEPPADIKQKITEQFGA